MLLQVLNKFHLKYSSRKYKIEFLKPNKYINLVEPK